MKHFLDYPDNPINSSEDKKIMNESIFLYKIYKISKYDHVLEIYNNICRTHLTRYTLFANKNASHGENKKGRGNASIKTC